MGQQDRTTQYVTDRASTEHGIERPTTARWPELILHQINRVLGEGLGIEKLDTHGLVKGTPEKRPGRKRLINKAWIGEVYSRALTIKYVTTIVLGENSKRVRMGNVYYPKHVYK